MNLKNKIDVLSQISPQMKSVVNHILSNTLSSDGSIDMMRKNYEIEREFWNNDAPNMQKEDEIVLNLESQDIRLNFYYPNANATNLICFIHGGGFVVGSNKTHQKIMKLLAKYSGNVVVGIDYTLAPDKKFPTQIKQCAFAIQFLRKNACKFGLNSENLSLAGDSAGAYLCLATYLWLRKFDDAKFIKNMALYYGIYGLKDSTSRRLYGNEIDWLRKEDFEYYYKEYLTNLDELDSEFVDIFASDLSSDIPPCFIAAAEFDPLIDDSKTLFEIISKNTNSEYKIYKGVMHAFLHYSKMLDTALEAIKDGANFINLVSKTYL